MRAKTTSEPQNPIMENRRHKPDVMIAVFTFLLMMLGLIVIYAIGPLRANFMNSAYGININPNDFFIKQSIMTFISVVAFIVFYKIPFSVISKISKPLLLAGILSCVFLMVLSLARSGLARCELGACRWYRFGPIGFQPAELLKFGLILYFADFFARLKRQQKIGQGSDFWLPFIVITGISIFLIVVVQKDLGTGSSIMAILLAMLFSTNINWLKFGGILICLMLASLIFIFSSPHRVARLATFNSSDNSNKYHIENAMLAIGTGGLFGVGVGNSVQATGYLPESINDSIFAVMGETFGFIGLTFIISLFYLLLMRILVSASKILDDQKRFILIGVFAWLGSHIVINIMSMTGLIPLTGITLPLLSFGGTSIVFTSAMLGLSMMLSCYTNREELKGDFSR